MKNLHLFIFSFVIFFTLPTIVYARDEINCLSTFKDVEPDTPMCFYTSYLDYQRVISGFSDLTFRENENLTRGQMSKFIVNAFQIPLIAEVEEDDEFPDINENHTFYEYIYTLKDEGIVNGYSDETFKPDEPVSRGQVTKFLANAIEYKDPEALLDKTVRGKNYYRDINEDYTFYDYILKLYVATQHENSYDQILELPENLEFKPEEYLTRGDMAKMVTNSMFYTDIRNKISLPKYSNLLEGIKSSDTFADSLFEVNHYEDYGLTVVSTEEPYDYVYEALNPRSVEEIAVDNDYEFMFNAGFFGAGYNDSGYSTEHAGLLQILGVQYTPLKEEEDSTQLTHVAVLDRKNNNLNFVHRNDYEEINDEDYIIFQTGPSVIMGNRAEKDNIFNSKNGRVQRPRTLMGMTSNKEKHYFIFRYNYSLNEIADIMLHLNIFEEKELSVLNLDGGSSIAFYSEEYPQLSYGTTKHLPNLIGF